MWGLQMGKIFWNIIDNDWREMEEKKNTQENNGMSKLSECKQWRE